MKEFSCNVIFPILFLYGITVIVGTAMWTFGGSSEVKYHEWRRFMGALIWPFVIQNERFEKWMNEEVK